MAHICSKENGNLLDQQTWRIIDQSAEGLALNPLFSFAADDCLCTRAGSNNSPPSVRFWVHRPFVVLGIQDTKLPYLKDGLAFLREKGYPPVVRNSGGLAVLLDEGVLNVTLVFPDGPHLSIEQGYGAMYTLIKEALEDFSLPVQAGEVAGSYCPGSYDLSINGKKFAGISQRRMRKGAAVQIYICVNGSGSKRAEIIRGFYSVAKKGAETKTVYPEINPKAMGSLSELLGKDVSVRQIKERILARLGKYSRLLFSSFTEIEREMLETYKENLAERNKKIIGG